MPDLPAGAPAAKPKDLVRIDCHSGSARRDGRWMVPRRMEVQVTSGSVTLDFTEAVTWWPSLQLDVAVHGGSLRLVTKPGIGTTNLYAALDVASGLVISQLTARHRAIEFRRFLGRTDSQVPAGLEVHVICDNSSTHTTPEIRRWLVRHPRFQLHFTPTYRSWLNLVERWFAELTTKWLKRGTHRSVGELTASIQAWIEAWTRTPGRSCGPRPPTRSSTTSPDISSESLTQDTRR